MSARALMLLGTASHVGKSILTAALCRIFADEGVRVAPFKAQNMSLNSAATPDGREIGRAQALQAEACRIPACVDMNPVLIKPSSDTGSQIVLLGRVWGQVTAADYHTRRVEQLFPAVLESYQRLASQYDLIVLEGAGSPAEINLMAHDIVNLRMAEAAGAACLLVGDIDRGGVFASLLGTLELLDSRERALIRGYAINKFRGDVSLLRPGIEMMAPRLKIPCSGIIPYLHNLGLDEEDGVAVEDRRDARREESLSQYRQEKVRTRDLQDQIDLEVRLALNSLRAAVSEIETAREGLTLAESEVTQAQRRYRAGVANSIEVTDAQTRLDRARENQIAALYDYNLARLDLATATGTIGEYVNQ